MARVTVEDCLSNINNRFELVLAASKRARQLAQGTTPLVPTEHDKLTVVALREIAAGVVTQETLKEIEEAPIVEFINEVQTQDAEIQTPALDPAGSASSDADAEAKPDA